MDKCTGKRWRFVGVVIAGVLLLICPGCKRGPENRPARVPSPEEVQQMAEIKDMVLVPAIDTFTAGSRQYPPQQTGPIDAFHVSPCEVTQAFYELVMGSNPSVGAHGDRLPVQNVSWIDAARFCNRLSKIMGLEPCYDERSGFACDVQKSGYRLPLSREWEYACRGDSTSLYFWGAEPSAEYCVPPLTQKELNEVGNTLAHCAARPVMSRKPNALGLFDMSGNVAEWCLDSFGEDPTYRVYRGGSWEDCNWKAFESKASSGMRQSDATPMVGFRIVGKP